MADNKSGLWRWMLVGCGAVLLMGMIGCGGCMYVAGKFLTSRMDCIEQADTLIRTSDVVKRELGGVRGVERPSLLDMKRNDPYTLEFKVSGTDQDGTVSAKMDFVMPRLVIKSVHLNSKGKLFPLK